jgi:hypothetical protein
MMTLGGAGAFPKKRLCMRLSTKGYTLCRIVSRERSSLLLRKRRLANVFVVVPWRQAAKR